MKMKKKNVTMILIFSLIVALIFMIPTISNAKDVIYKEPSVNSSGTDKDGLDDMINDAQDFENREIEISSILVLGLKIKLLEF